MLLTMVGAALSALLMPMVIVQFQVTGSATGRSHSLHAAQAGLDTAVAQILAAHDDTTDADNNLNGRTSKLPCGTLTGTVDGAQRYSVTIDYFAAEPQPGQYVAGTGAYNTTWISTNRLSCPAPDSRFALLRSQGTDNGALSFDVNTCPALMRCLRATYRLRTTNEPILGGLILTQPRNSGGSDRDPDLCWDAGPEPWEPNTTVTTEECHPEVPQRRWAYTKDLTLMLADTASSSAGPLCMDSAGPRPGAQSVLTLQRCATPVPTSQRWSADGDANFNGTMMNGGVPEAACIYAASWGETSPLLVGPSRTYCRKRDWQSSFNPDSSVGAGAAGQPGTDQLVNRKQFSRCLDVPTTDRESDYLTAYPCKQALNPADVEWNERWKLPPIGKAGHGTGRITTEVPAGTNQGAAGTYCLVAPPDFSVEMYVDAEPCGTAGARATWTVYKKFRDYDTSWRILSGYPPSGGAPFGMCLAAKDNALGDFRKNEAGVDLGYQTSKVIVAACDGLELQKWNAPANILGAIPLKDIGER
ncbi:MAG TPA: hypothetical protein VK453_17655 [Micromonosporaceae bacterium]|nr:hypothetical protein [Micromonosporaceae bacterium]